jgi:very-short-patch-repair endonuclease
MIARGALVREHHGVYRVGHAAAIPWGAETSALLACASTTVLSHRSAAVLWGLLPKAGCIEVTVMGAQTGKPDGVIVHRSRTLLSRDVTVRDALPVTSVARTLLDLAGVVKARMLERAVDQALLTRLATRSQLTDVLDRSIGRRGAASLRGIVEREGPSTRTRSRHEERFLALVRQGGLPAPEVNGRIEGFEVDFLWRAERVALEIDTWDFHRTRNAFERDRRKGAVLSARGLSVVRATDTQLEEEPVAVVVRVAQTLAHAA